MSAKKPVYEVKFFAVLIFLLSHVIGKAEFALSYGSYAYMFGTLIANSMLLLKITDRRERITSSWTGMHVAFAVYLAASITPDGSKYAAELYIAVQVLWHLIENMKQDYILQTTSVTQPNASSDATK